MSWLSGIAKGAEELLNKVDQTAASAFHSQGESPPDIIPSRAPASNYSPYLTQTSKPSLSPSASVPNNLGRVATKYPSRPSSNPRSTYSSVQAPARASPTRAKKDQDAELFEFLNSPDNVEEKEMKKPERPSQVVALNGQHSRKSSTSSIGSHRSKTPDARDIVAMESGTRTPSSQRSTGNESDNAAHSSPEDDSLVVVEKSSSYQAAPEDSTSQQMSALELENRLLKNEVASLNQEMTSVIHRAKNAQAELVEVKKRLDSQNTAGDQMIRELQARESDFSEALEAKDSQLAILRVRLEEADKDLSAKKQTILQLEAEKNRVLADHTSSSDIHGQAVDTLKEKLNETEAALRREKENYRISQEETESRHHQLQVEKSQLSDSLASVQKKLSDEKARVVDISSQVKGAKSQAEAARQELVDYKDKATRILQSKDRLIASLKEGGAGGDSSSITTAELEEARQERDVLREELQQSRMTVESLRSEIQDLEMQLQTDHDALQETTQSLEEQLATEKQNREDAELECHKQKQELRFAHEELLKQKTQYQGRLQDREAEIERLRNQLTTRTASSTSQVELENRLHALTESLIHKQTMMEALSTEKNSLGLQLERLEIKYRDLESASTQARSTTVNMNEDDEVHHRMPGFMRESPMDSNVARKVKRAAGTIDRFSIRLGIFLRRYPIARIFVIIYMALLHLWVTFVLLTYQPEIHGDEHFAPEPPEDAS